VSSKIHINGWRNSEPVRKDMGITTAYSRFTGVAAKVMDRGENLGNPSRVNQVSKMEQHYPSRISRVGRVNQDSNTDQQADRVS
jgi:hypothetical protein